MKVAIIGAGNVGKALGTSLARAGHEVTLAANSPESAQAAAAEIGVESADSAASAVTDANVVILAIPYQAGAGVADEIAGGTVGRTIIDVTNPLKADYSGLATDTSAAEELQQRLPDAHVVKAFNTIFATNQSDPSGTDAPIDGFVAGDDPGAKQTVISLVESIGMQPLDVGPLSSARYLEGMAFINIGLNAANGWSWTSAWKLER
ncbi:MAG: NADPH-dependent F420 reductase [Candidatus Limnocylindria bacterium]